MTRSLVLLIVAAMTITSSAAAWSGKGSYEPSTQFDRDQDFMFKTSPQTNDGTKRVYFNGFVTDGQVVVTSTSPNSGLLESSLYASMPMVMMGIWRDCNKDNYIGNTDGLYVYPAQLLDQPNLDGVVAGNSVCPASPVMPTHNNGRWVFEFLPLVWNNATFNNVACCDPNVFVDNKAKVWADYGLPDAVTRGPGVCEVGRPAEHTYDTTGGMLAYVDCQNDYAATHAINGLGEPFTFSDKPDGKQGESDSALNRPIGWGQSEDASYVSAWDCSDTTGVQRVIVMDPTGGKTYNKDGNGDGRDDETGAPIVPVLGPQAVRKFGVPGQIYFTGSNDRNEIYRSGPVNTKLSPPTVNQGGSFWGTLNHTDAESSDCDRTNSTLGDNDECVVYCEVKNLKPWPGRTRPDAMLISAEWPHRYNQNGTEGFVDEANDKYLQFIGSDFRQYWYTFDASTQTGPVSRDNTLAGRGPLAEARYWTFYGFVSPTAVTNLGLMLPGGTATGKYGSEACDATALDGKTRFDCTAANWWIDTDGDAMNPQDTTPDSTSESRLRTAWNMCARECDPRAIVGDTYNLRDVDCYDYSIGILRANDLTTADLAGKGC